MSVTGPLSPLPPLDRLYGEPVSADVLFTLLGGAAPLALSLDDSLSCLRRDSFEVAVVSGAGPRFARSVCLSCSLVCCIE